MSRFTTGFDVGKKLCEAMGIDPSGTRGLSIKIDCQVEEMVTVTVTRFVTAAEAEALAEVLQEVRPVIVEQTCPTP